MAAAECAIWKTRAELLEKAGDFEVFDSPRAGGKYWISGTGIGQIISFNDRAKRLLTTWLCQQRHSGVEAPKINADIVEIIKARRDLPVTDRLNAALIFVASNLTDISGSLSLGGPDEITLRFFAETESRSLGELSKLCTMLRDLGVIDGAFSLSGFVSIRPTARGWSEFEKLTRTSKDSSQAFVAMWFNGQTNDAYFNGIAPALGATGYKPMRIDKKDHNNKIDDEIIAEIRRSRFVVADFTCEPEKVRGGVYFEAGFALGLGIPVIWTCKETSKDDLHFDTRQYAHIMWKDAADLYAQLKSRVGATVGDGPLPKL
jgi:nucleoside 2-deoxyribosyltransferase